MKVYLEQVQDEAEKIIIQYNKMTPQIEDIIHYIELQNKRLIGVQNGKQVIIELQAVIYLESVDGVTYIYTETQVYKTDLTLASACGYYGEHGYFRCSKSMVINIYRIRQLKSLSGNRIDALMDNGEHVLISRRYARELRSVLKGEV